MTDQEALRQLSQECPRKIMAMLHARGPYIHCTSTRFPGKILCFHEGGDLPADAVLTAAQQHFCQTAAHSPKGASA
jgi:hypothetical protein